MMCRPGRPCSTTMFEFNGILTHVSPITNFASPCDSKIAVGHIAISFKFWLMCSPSYKYSKVIEILNANTRNIWTVSELKEGCLCRTLKSGWTSDLKCITQVQYNATRVLNNNDAYIQLWKQFSSDMSLIKSNLTIFINTVNKYM